HSSLPHSSYFSPFFPYSVHHLDLHSFPTTTLFRSDDLDLAAWDVAQVDLLVEIDRPGVAGGNQAELQAGRGKDQGLSLCRDVEGDRKSTRLNSSHVKISYAVFCLKKKNTIQM